jgi:hypothetical protein
MSKVYLHLTIPFSNATNTVFSAHRDREHAILCAMDLLKLHPYYKRMSREELRRVAENHVAEFDVFEEVPACPA